jgi:chitin disaccharide deacetylase
VAKHLIINADDFGASKGINRGILECHTRGVVTSASLMVTGRAVAEAVAMSRDHPDLSLGLHWDVWGEDERSFDTRDLAAVRDEFRRQLEEFERLVGKLPTHFDSHRHAHREKHLFPLFRELVAPSGRPLRGDGRARFTGGFYGQWEWLVTDLEHVSVDYLEQLLREEVVEGWNEISCHPGYASADFRSVYMAEREVEVVTLTDPRIREAVDGLGLRLGSFGDIPCDRPDATA